MDILPAPNARRLRRLPLRRRRRRRPGPGTLLLVLVALAAGTLLLPSITAGGLASVDEIHYTFSGPTSVTFDWRGSADDLQYGTTASYGATVYGTTPNPAPISSSGPWWEATITGLAAGATYHYSIGGGADGTFAAAPTGSFRFTSVGDIGSSATYPRIATIQSLMAAMILPSA
ncbi:MAG: fibronectin type III domain-containing protein [Actinomycetota bacterium]